MVKEFSGDVYLNGIKLSTMVAFVIDPFFPVCRSSILEDILVAPFFFFQRQLVYYLSIKAGFIFNIFFNKKLIV